MLGSARRAALLFRGHRRRQADPAVSHRSERAPLPGGVTWHCDPATPHPSATRLMRIPPARASPRGRANRAGGPGALWPAEGPVRPLAAPSWRALRGSRRATARWPAHESRRAGFGAPPCLGAMLGSRPPPAPGVSGPRAVPFRSVCAARCCRGAAQDELAAGPASGHRTRQIEPQL